MNPVSGTRIAKNTILLYIRMIITMLIALYTSRVVLRFLDIDGYGLYNIVGGVVAMFSFLNNAMSAATQRFITYELGTKNSNGLNRVFSMSMTSHMVIMLFFVLLAESIGLWFLNSIINIPAGKEVIANWIYQCSIITLCFNIVLVPYSASIIANEKMGVYAVVSIIDAVLKLCIAIALSIAPFEKITFYSVLLAVESIIIFIIYRTICRYRFEMCHYHLLFDKNLFLRLLGFSGWSMLGQLSVVGANQGNNILINIFYTVKVNATMGIANQINMAVNNLVSNFQTAFQPQITKSYAAGDFDNLNSLMRKSAKLSFFLLYIVAFPVILNIEDLLVWWLDTVPPYGGIFCTLIIVASMVNAIAGPLWMAIFATGNIGRYQIVISIINFLDIPIVYLLFKLGFQPASAIVVNVIINVVMLATRIIFCSKRIDNFNVKCFFNNVITPIVLVVILSGIIIIPLNYWATELTVWLRCLVIAVSLIINISIIYVVGINVNERAFVREVFNKVIKSGNKCITSNK